MPALSFRNLILLLQVRPMKTFQVYLKMNYYLPKCFKQKPSTFQYSYLKSLILSFRKYILITYYFQRGGVNLEFHLPSWPSSHANNLSQLTFFGDISITINLSYLDLTLLDQTTLVTYYYFGNQKKLLSSGDLCIQWLISKLLWCIHRHLVLTWQWSSYEDFISSTFWMKQDVGQILKDHRASNPQVYIFVPSELLVVHTDNWQMAIND